VRNPHPIKNNLERSMDTVQITDTDLQNRDPITGEPGAHPVAVGVGAAAGGAATGAALGTTLGPIGTVVGTLAGGVVGALAGKAIGEKVNPTEEDAYWEHSYKLRPYVPSGIAYHVYRPAYRYGWESRGLHEGKRFEEVEHDLRSGWGATTDMEWDDARPAVRDAWDRVDQRSNPIRPDNSDSREDRQA
jgi:hypothetical protein